MNKTLKIFLWIFVFWILNTLFSSPIYADSNPSWDYTYIDCKNGSDTNAIPFDRTKPYMTLKKWVEATIQYINDNWLTSASWTWVDFTSSVFNIYVKAWCFYNGIDWNNVDLNFAWIDNNSTLNIAWVWWNFLIDNVYFNLTNPKSWNITFRNVNFWRNDTTWYYFNWAWDFVTSMNWSWIKIYNSLININSWKQLVRYSDWGPCYRSARRGGCPYNIRPGWYFIENSLINLNISWDTNFRTPVYLKNNKIVVKNNNTDWNKYTLRFTVAWNNRDWYNYWSINMFANEIDVWWNHLNIDGNGTYLNNKFEKVYNMTIWSTYTTFINNQVDCKNVIDTTWNESAFNNLFVNWVTDSRDVNNFKKNFSPIIPVWEKWIWWLLRKDISATKSLNTDYRLYYKEVTGNTLTTSPNPLYIIVH